MERKKYVIFTAAGSGTRMKSSEPKQFLLLGGLPVLHRSIFAFVDACPDVKVITVLPKNQIERWKDLCIEYPLDVPQVIVEGGITRFHSVRNALAKVPDGAIVAVHDGVRPLVSKDLIRTMFGKMRECRALVPVVPVTDTLKSLERGKDGELVSTGNPDPDRSRVFGAQTPQMFLSEELRAAYSLPYDISYTDDASVAARYGIPLSWIEGERNNIKLTTPGDMALAELFI
ncbi:MAG: 2-C-methyl-D-erythritol 4-phosphate cytidylyltransferase [Bacteroidales bacterium]|nr:2-C-methyl-D-erythritol 4-phosphate cytidylyltransferase [Bacteroidales bacterium]